MESLSLRREVISGSTHPRLISDWWAEIDVAASMGELDNSGFVFDKEFETLGSRITKGIMKIILAQFKRKTNYLKDTQYTNKCPILTGRQIIFQILSFFNNFETQEHAMNLNDMLNVELYNQNLNMFNQAWEETLLALGNDLDENVLNNLYDRQVSKSTLMKNTSSLYQSATVPQKEPRSYQKLRTMVNGLRASTTEHVESAEGVLKRQSSTSVLFE